MSLKLHTLKLLTLNQVRVTLRLYIRYRAGPEIGYVVENLDEVNARSVPKTEASGDSSIKYSKPSTKSVTVPSSIKAKNNVPVVASGVLPPKTFKYPSVSAPISSSSNTYESIR